MIPLFPKLDKNKKTIENIPVKELLNQYGSPLFVMSERIIKEKYNLFRAALDKYYPNSQIAYSVKTNYLPRVVNIMKNLGAWAEVVSGFEYWLVKKIGFAENQIIFNGPDKKTGDIEQALKNGALINIDNRNELERIETAAKNFDHPIKIGLRVNMKIGKYPWDRFGFDLENGQALSVIKKLNKQSKIGLIGLHAHIGTNLDEPGQYAEAAMKLADFASEIKKGFDIDFEYLDLGGGFAVPGSRWLNNPVWVVPEIEEYIRGIADIINEKWPNKKPRLFFEPGRYLVDEAGILLTTVNDVKEININNQNPRIINMALRTLNTLTKKQSKAQLINVDSSVTSTFQSALFRSSIIEPILFSNETSEYTFDTFIGGNSCVGNDFLARNISLPKLSVNDVLVFYNAGAYAIPRSTQFIHPRPAVVMVKENGNVECIRKKESYENMIALDNLG